MRAGQMYNISKVSYNSRGGKKPRVSRGVELSIEGDFGYRVSREEVFRRLASHVAQKKNKK